MKTNLKQRNGITLIALVITIIVLLILAGVTIATLTGENGILTRASEASIETRGASVEEAKNLWKTNVEADKQTSTNTAQTLDELLEDLEKQKLLTSDEVKTVKETGQVTIGSRTIVFGTSEATLVEMFKKAQEDGCTNEDGTCTNEDHLHIGDYVDYKNPTSGSYTITSDKSGIEAEQIYSVSSNQLNWRVLGIDEETGGLKLIAGSPMKLDAIDGKDDPYLYLNGAEAYVYGPDEMNKIGALYKNEYAQTARSINIEDINQAVGITTEEQIKENNALVTMNDAIQYGEKYGPFASQWTPEDWLKADQPTSTVSGTVDAYAYIIGEESGMVNVENTRLKNMLFNNVEYQVGKAYWVASRGAYAYSGVDCAYFGPGVVDGENGMTGAGVGYDTSYSYGLEYGRGFAVRPVVVLKSDITKDQINKIADKVEEDWQFGNTDNEES